MSDLEIFNNLSVVIKPKICVVSNKGLVVNTAKNQYIKAPKVKTKIEISDNVTQCFNIPSIEFSNCYPRTLDEGALYPNISIAFDKINEDIGIIKDNMKDVSISGTHEGRIKQILKKYLDDNDFDNYSDNFYKSDVKTGVLLHERGSFRVISLYFVEPLTHKRQKHSKHRIIVLFFDPYHLFIPSKDYGTKIYNEISGYSGDCTLLKL